MAVSFENKDFVLSAEIADHINERHVDKEKSPRASKFYLKYNLTSAMAMLTKRT